MSYKTISLEMKDHTAIVNIPSLDDDQTSIKQLSVELNNLCEDLNMDEKTRVVILTGSDEKSFSLGKDILQSASIANNSDSIKLYSIAEAISKLDCPVIAAINGDAIGLGMELALSCDLRIAVESALFGLPHVTIGLIPWDGGTQRLSRLVGKGKAMEMIITGEIIDTQEALRIGLVNKVFSIDKLMTETIEIANKMASSAPIALKHVKEAIYKGLDLTLEQGLRLEGDLYFLLHTTNDRTEGITSFREKRTPKFEGR